MAEETDFLKLSLDELFKAINELKNIDTEDELLEKMENHYSNKMDENKKAFSLLKEEIEKNNDLNFDEINLELYDINFVDKETKQTIYEFAIFSKNEKLFNQLFEKFENDIAFNSLGKGHFLIIELISFLGFSTEIIESVFKKMNPSYIAHYRNKIIYLQALLKKEEIDKQNLYDFYRVLGERVRENIFSKVVIEAYEKCLLSDDLDELEDLIQDYRTDQYLNRIYKMLSPKRKDNDYSATLLYLTIIFYELRKAIEIIKKEEEEDKKQEEEAKKSLEKQPKIEEVFDEKDI